MELLIWILTIVCFIIGTAGVIVPLLPGTTLILAGVMLHKLVLPTSISWWSVVLIVVLWALSVAADLLGVVFGAKMGGGGKWSMGGAGVGALVGVFWSLPGIILGTFLGAAVAEKVATDKTSVQSLKAGLGAGVGFLLATGVRLVLALLMIAVFVVDLVFF
jgi:uncharacterized protein YqgC (DUF456 family)